MPRPPATSSGSKSADAAILTQPGRLLCIDLNPPAASDATLVIYDNASAASGTVLMTVTATAGQGSVHIETDRICNNGIYVDVTGTTTYVIGYSVG